MCEKHCTMKSQFCCVIYNGIVISLYLFCISTSAAESYSIVHLNLWKKCTTKGEGANTTCIIKVCFYYTAYNGITFSLCNKFCYAIKSWSHYIYEKGEKKYLNSKDLCEWKERKRKWTKKEKKDKRNEEREEGSIFGGVGKGILIFILGLVGIKSNFVRAHSSPP